MCIKPESVFGQMKHDMGYRQFKHFSKNKVSMEFAFFAIAFNIKKPCAKLVKGVLTLFVASLQVSFAGYYCLSAKKYPFAS